MFTLGWHNETSNVFFTYSINILPSLIQLLYEIFYAVIIRLVEDDQLVFPEGT